MRDPWGIQEIPPKNSFHDTTAGKDNLYFAKCGPDSELSFNDLLSNRGGTVGERSTVLSYFFLPLQNKTLIYTFFIL